MPLYSLAPFIFICLVHFLFILLFLCLFIGLSHCLFICILICLFISLFHCLFSYLFACLFTYPLAWLPTYLLISALNLSLAVTRGSQLDFTVFKSSMLQYLKIQEHWIPYTSQSSWEHFSCTRTAISTELLVWYIAVIKAAGEQVIQLTRQIFITWKLQFIHIEISSLHQVIYIERAISLAWSGLQD